MKIMVHNCLKQKGQEIVCSGAISPFFNSCPDFINLVANSIETGEYDNGILICGNGKNLSFIHNK
jgi:ribose 5-phosphate isomerase RpiB